MNTIATQHEYIISHLYLAKKMAKSKRKKITFISYDELLSAAYFGLVQAAKSYTKESNDCFAAYAVWRITGAIKDYLRELSWGSRKKPLKRVEYSYLM